MLQYNNGTYYSDKEPNKWILVALFLGIFAIILLTSGCVTQSKCNAKFPPEVIKETKDSIVYKETVRDSLVKLPGEILKIRDYAYCDSLNRAQFPKTTFHSGRTHGTVEIKDNKLSVDCKTDSLEALLKVKDKIIESYHKEKTTIKPPPVVIYKIHWYDKGCRWIAILSTLCLGLYIYFKIKP